MWSAQQQSMLNAMGYTLYVRPSAVTRVAAAEVSSTQVLLASSDLPSSSSTLFKAVMKAVQGKDIAQLGIDIDAMRNSPQAKRALWPQLRKLMKS
jgi:DNA polymerase III psi subunit